MPDFRREIVQLAAERRDCRVTVVRTGALGDTVLLLPTLQLLREALPRARVTLIGSSWAEQLLPLMIQPPDLVRFDSQVVTPLFSEGPASDPAGIFEGADLALIYTSDQAAALVRNARRFCVGHVLCWPVMPARGTHAACYLASALFAGAARRWQIPLPSLQVPAEAMEWARHWLAARAGSGARDSVAVHPGSGGGRKCWPVERFASLVERLRADGRRILVMEGPADREVCEEILRRCGAAGGVLRARPADVRKAAALIASCDVYVGNDSGLTHLAAALGVPTVAIFGPTDPAVWAPLGASVQVLCGEGAGEGGGGCWPGEDVMATAARLLGTSNKENSAPSMGRA